MSGDAPMASALSEKEQKKLKRQEKKAGVKPKGEVEVEDGGCINDISVNDSLKEKKEEKKRKKKQKKEKEKEKELQESGVATENGVVIVDAEAMERAAKKEQKKGKKNKFEDCTPQLGPDGVVDDGDVTMAETGSNNIKKGDKKRKRGEEQGEAGGLKDDGQEKRKKKHKDEMNEDLAADAQEKQKKGKGEKKQKHVILPETYPAPDAPPTKASSAPSGTSSSEILAFLEHHSVTVTLPASATASDNVPPILSFPGLPIPEGLKKAFDGFKEPTPIQACTWPHALLGSDVVGIAETGSGKTLAFGIPALSRIISPSLSAPSPGVSILVVAPTRELAIQTHDTLSDLGKPFGIASVAVFGGVPKEGQIKMLQQAGVAGGDKRGKNKGNGGGGLVTKIVVGTPGRILDLINDGVCDLSGVEYLVLDEADRMLDKGFENDIRRIIEQTKPKTQRQTMMFSATWPEAVRRLASTFQRDPVRVTIGSDDLTANSRVEQMVEVFDDPRSKDNRLLNHLKALSHKKGASSLESSRILVFALYKKEASRVEYFLKQQGFSVGALHGDMSQTARMEALDNFKNGVYGLLVATDVAARGLDIPNVAAVINYTFPLTIEDYIHRIGRTGRGGKSGKSITFFTGENHERALAGELARVLRESGFDHEPLKKFPMTIKKKEHGVYGAFFRDDIPIPKGPTKIKFS